MLLAVAMCASYRLCSSGGLSSLFGSAVSGVCAPVLALEVLAFVLASQASQAYIRYKPLGALE